MITTGGEGQFFKQEPIGFWLNGQFVLDYNFDGEGALFPPFSFDTELTTHTLGRLKLAGEDFDRDLGLENIDFGVYVRISSFTGWTPCDRCADVPLVIISICTLNPGKRSRSRAMLAGY